MYHFVLILGGNIIAPPVRAVNARLHIRAESFPYRLLQMLRTTVLVIIGELFFRANGLRAGMQMFRTMVTGFAFPVFDDALFKALGIDKFDLMIVAVTLLIVFVVSVINEKGKSVRALLAQRPAARSFCSSSFSEHMERATFPSTPCMRTFRRHACPVFSNIRSDASFFSPCWRFC